MPGIQKYATTTFSVCHLLYRDELYRFLANRSHLGQEYARIVGHRYAMQTDTGEGTSYSTDFVRVHNLYHRPERLTLVSGEHYLR